MVNVGSSKDTAEFAVESIRQWWVKFGRTQYPLARKLLICGDGGGSNGSRNRGWKYNLQELSDETGLTISVCHYPPGTSKWNKIEHRMFSFIPHSRCTEVQRHRIIALNRRGFPTHAEFPAPSQQGLARVRRSGKTAIEEEPFFGQQNIKLPAFSD